ncbi:MAG: hypothetical protein JRE40_15565 [Deltaproteobacteria bacterium]|nr:hypothetical protein [Deltaproteobacteria bacterium]
MALELIHLIKRNEDGTEVLDGSGEVIEGVVFADEDSLFPFAEMAEGGWRIDSEQEIDDSGRLPRDTLLVPERLKLRL